MQGLTVGRIVHYIDGDSRHRAAIVTAVVTGGFGTADIAVFAPDSLMFLREIEPDLDPHNNTPNTWHWIERA